MSLSTVFAACTDESGLESLSAGNQAQVRAVLSGDTVLLDGGESVHLAGVEAPRPGQPYADEARTLLDQLAAGQRVQLLYGGARTDPFGRGVAQVSTVRGRRWLEGALVDAGAVRVRTFADNRALARTLLAREARARAAHRGLWALADYRVRLPEEVSEGDRGLVLVEGRVARTGHGRDGDVYLDFSPDWRTGVSAEIRRTALRDFRAAGYDPRDLEGRLIRVRGALRGRRIVVDHPEQVERLKG